MERAIHSDDDNSIFKMAAEKRKHQQHQTKSSDNSSDGIDVVGGDGVNSNSYGLRQRKTSGTTQTKTTGLLSFGSYSLTHYFSIRLNSNKN